MKTTPYAVRNKTNSKKLNIVEINIKNDQEIKKLSRLKNAVIRDIERNKKLPVSEENISEFVELDEWLTEIENKINHLTNEL